MEYHLSDRSWVLCLIFKLAFTSLKSNNQSMCNIIISIQNFNTTRQSNWNAVSQTIILLSGKRSAADTSPSVTIIGYTKRTDSGELILRIRSQSLGNMR